MTSDEQINEATDFREDDYLELLQAVEATSQGRWFLGEYARRIREAGAQDVCHTVEASTSRLREVLLTHTNEIIARLDELSEEQGAMKSQLSALEQKVETGFGDFAEKNDGQTVIAAETRPSVSLEALFAGKKPSRTSLASSEANEPVNLPLPDKIEQDDQVKAEESEEASFHAGQTLEDSDIRQRLVSRLSQQVADPLIAQTEPLSHHELTPAEQAEEIDPLEQAEAPLLVSDDMGAPDVSSSDDQIDEMPEVLDESVEEANSSQMDMAEADIEEESDAALAEASLSAPEESAPFSEIDDQLSEPEPVDDLIANISEVLALEEREATRGESLSEAGEDIEVNPASEAETLSNEVADKANEEIALAFRQLRERLKTYKLPDQDEPSDDRATSAKSVEVSDNFDDDQVDMTSGDIANDDKELVALSSDEARPLAPLEAAFVEEDRSGDALSEGKPLDHDVARSDSGESDTRSLEETGDEAVSGRVSRILRSFLRRESDRGADSLDAKTAGADHRSSLSEESLTNEWDDILDKEQSAVGGSASESALSSVEADEGGRALDRSWLEKKMESFSYSLNDKPEKQTTDTPGDRAFFS